MPSYSLLFDCCLLIGTHFYKNDAALSSFNIRDIFIKETNYLTVNSVRAVVVVQLVEYLLPTRENRGSNPNIGNDLYVNCII